uniref:GPR155 protein n=1 Tax=Fopius arisanus TaxID=64838 RepID=A0A0C9QTL9_9HYME
MHSHWTYLLLLLWHVCGSLFVSSFSRGKKWKRPTHRCTICIIIAQFTVAVGVIIWTKLEVESTGSPLWYIQCAFITGGVYASRLLTATMAATLLFLTSKSVSFVRDLQRWIVPAALVIPVILIALMCAIITPRKSPMPDLRNPNFQLGSAEGAVSIFILLFSFIVTIGCLVLHQRYQRRQHTEAYASLIGNNENVESTTIETRNVVDVEDLITPISPAPTNPCGLDNNCTFQRGLCAAATGTLDEYEAESDNERETRNDDDPQILRHVVFIIFLLCSMFIGLVLSVGTMIMEQMTGVYAELAFLDVAFNFGQPLIAFGIFGLDPSLGRLGKWLKNACQEWKARQKLQLPDEASLSPEARMIREQFSRCHLRECRERISMCRRRLLTVYEGVFSGTDLVNWLLEADVAQNRDEAVRYGRCLLESRVLHHVDGTHHFQDKNILYTFRG